MAGGWFPIEELNMKFFILIKSKVVGKELNFVLRHRFGNSKIGNVSKHFENFMETKEF